MTLPDWLPPMLDLDSDWDACLPQLYAVFERDFKRGNLKLAGDPVWYDRRIIDGYEACFWHLITREHQKTHSRGPDFRRAERLPWCAVILHHAHDPAVKFWRYKEGSGVIRTYAWLEEGDYVVVLEPKQKQIGLVAFMITAYHVDGSSRRRNLQQRYEKREL
ncbi:MAG: hypothetical protein Fur005_37090 [Roseiflexaceae bacterium]